ncbi:hypothetical protein LR48_Vigan630s000300 [Vigna angularis]|uniref:Uncharacterized protein n=1 Tax=Phaseolus angularis TaxID=3914 RepID=A0A0L9TG24_PHAAN|nr:hypothetical protein LR48_Vigan630s000300 [Vigna angularis]
MLESPKTLSSHLSCTLPPFFHFHGAPLISLTSLIPFFVATSHQRSKLPTPSAATRPLSYLHQHITLHFFYSRFSLARQILSRECSSSSPTILHHRSISSPQKLRGVRIELAQLISSSPRALFHQLAPELRFRPQFIRQR